MDTGKELCNPRYLLKWLNTYLLTPWSTVLLEKLASLQLVKKFPAFYGTRRFLTALRSARHLSLSWASPIQSSYPTPTSWRSILIKWLNTRHWKTYLMFRLYWLRRYSYGILFKFTISILLSFDTNTFAHHHEMLHSSRYMNQVQLSPNWWRPVQEPNHSQPWPCSLLLNWAEYTFESWGSYNSVAKNSNILGCLMLTT